MIINQNKKSSFSDISICFHACKSNYMHFWAILSIWYPNEHLKISALIPKIHDFVVLRSMRSLNVNSLDKNIIFLLSIRSNIKFMKRMCYFMEGRMEGRTYVFMGAKVIFLFQNKNYDDGLCLFSDSLLWLWRPWTRTWRPSMRPSIK